MNQPCRRQTAAGRFSGNLMTKVTVYFRTIRSGFNIRRCFLSFHIELVFTNISFTHSRPTNEKKEQPIDIMVNPFLFLVQILSRYKY